jgi:ankyrin repeat protein
MVRLLIEKGADLNTPNKNGETPLYAVADNGHTDIVKLLVEKGADLNTPNKYGCTPLYAVALNGHTDIVKLLVEKGADLNTPNKDGETPLCTAVSWGHTEIVWGHTEIVRFLAEKGAELFIDHPFGDLIELNPLLIKLARYEDRQMTLIRRVIFRNITSSKTTSPSRELAEGNSE